MDTVSREKRSQIMSAVKSKDSRIESEFRKALWNAGYRYRKNVSDYFGKPDILLKKYQTVIFIDSCFWHGCKKHLRLPSSRIEYWERKIQGNKKRDEKVNEYYKRIGWSVIRVWEHDKKNLDKVIKKLRKITLK